MLRNSRGQILTIIEILVVVAILVVAGLYISQNYLGRSGSGDVQGAPETPIERAQSVDCMNNLRQIRYAIQLHQQTQDSPPASLDDIQKSGGLSSSMMKCPISGQPYAYDPAEGKVKCLQPGHGAY